MLPRPPSVLDDIEGPMRSLALDEPVPHVTQRIVAFSVHMRCDGTSDSKIVEVSKRSVERGLRSPTTIDEVQNLAAGPVMLQLGYGFDMGGDRLEHKIDTQTILGAWVTEQENPTVYKAHFVHNSTLRDGGTTQYSVEIEHPKKPGTYVPLRNAVGDKTVSLTIVFRQ